MLHRRPTPTPSACFVCLLGLVLAPFAGRAQTPADAIAGVVTSAAGAEAGVWVIAETEDFETRFAKIVVTDDAGRYLIPALPEANYQVWVRGYGLADSAKVAARRGDTRDLTATIAPNEAVAAQVYPAISWYSMLRMPAVEELPPTLHGDLNIYVNGMKNNGCIGCHQLGQHSTRTIPAALGSFESSAAAWTRRIQSGQAGAQMIRQATQFGDVAIKYLADWTDRIAKGELPAQRPSRPQGRERNAVVTVRDWLTPQHYLHDLTTTDRRNPTVNGYGLIYGSPELSTDDFPVLDPMANADWTYRATVRDPSTPTTHDDPVAAPSPYWGEERIWDSQANTHNPMIDERNRVWYTARVRGPDNPAWCREGSSNPSAQLFPTARSGRQLAMYDPQTKKYTHIDTCYGTHHLSFAEDGRHTLWTSGGDEVVGWLDREIYDRTGDETQAVMWSPFILDTNGNGRRDEGYTQPGEPIDPRRDARIDAGYYAVMPNPADGSVWGTLRTFPGALLRFDPGSNPPATGLTEIFNVPLPGYGPRGADIDRNGVVWVSLGSGHLGEFDRRKCTGTLNGPTATGDQCPEGWSFHRLPGPGFANRPQESAESSYYTWVDQHNTANLGANSAVVTGNLFDGVHVYSEGEFVTMRVPYPLGFYAKGLEGRIDDPNAGWKGRGLWITSGDRTPWLMETGKGTRPLVVHFQSRPHPLAN